MKIDNLHALTAKDIRSTAKYTKLNRRKNHFLEIGKTEEEVNERVKQLYEAFLHDPSYSSAVQQGDRAFVYDTGNLDVRSEGQSYAMLMAVMMHDKAFFDAVWLWTLEQMYLEDGPCRGYFAWSVPLDGRPKANGPAPDGEEFMIWALIWADKVFGSQESVSISSTRNYEETYQNYAAWAKRIVKDVLHRGDNEAGPMWTEVNLIEFVPDIGFTDPSYLIPHAYDIFADFLDDEDSERWREIAKTAREYLAKNAHPETGLYPEYAHYDGSPETTRGYGTFFSDAYRVLLNIAVDASLNGVSAVDTRSRGVSAVDGIGEADDGQSNWHANIAQKQLKFFTESLNDALSGTEDTISLDVFSHDYTIEGEKTGRAALHPLGLQSTVTTAFYLVKSPLSEELAKIFWDTELRKGDRRYFDNFLYIFSYLVLSGNYTI